MNNLCKFYNTDKHKLKLETDLPVYGPRQKPPKKEIPKKATIDSGLQAIFSQLG